MVLKAMTHKNTGTIYIWYLSRQERMVLIARQIEIEPFFYSSPGQWPTTAKFNEDIFGSQVKDADKKPIAIVTGCTINLLLPPLLLLYGKWCVLIKEINTGNYFS